MTPALLIRMSIGRPSALSCSPSAATEASDERSSGLMVSLASGTEVRISSIAFSPLARLRMAMTTSAPAAESRRASPNPRPLFAPVTTASFPDRSGTVATRLLAMRITPYRYSPEYLVAAGHPFFVMHDFVADGGAVAVAGMHDGVAGQLAEPTGDRLQNRREVGVGAPGGAGAAGEQRVAAEHDAQVVHVPTDRSGGVTRGVQRFELGAVDRQRVAIGDGTKVLVRVGHSPQDLVGWVQQYRCVQRLAELGRHRDVVVVTVRAHHRDHVAAPDRLDDRRRVVSGVEDHDVRVVAKQPDVVVDFPAAAVEFEGAV